MKRISLLLLLLVASVVSAAITGPYSVGPGAPPLTAAVARVSRVDMIFFPTPYAIVQVEQYVSETAMTEGVQAGATSFDIPAAELKEYVTDPLAAGTIHDLQTGVENWLLAKKLPGWTKL